MHPIAQALAELKSLYPDGKPAEPIAKQVAGFVIGMIALTIFFCLVESIWPEDPGQRRTARKNRIDFLYWVFDSLFAKVAVVASATLVIILVLFHVPHHPTWITGQPLWLQAIEALFVGDLTGYWIHRALHRIPWLWRFHAVHHSSERLNWLAAARVHPVENLIDKSLHVAPMFLLGFSPKILAFYGPLIAFYPVFVHANVKWDHGRFRYLVVSPRFHRWHHSSDRTALDTNFSGLLPIWDYLFGTAHMPETRRPERYGLAGEKMPESLRKQMMWPFIRQNPFH